MKVSHLIEELQSLPGDYDVCLSMYFVVTSDEVEGAEETDDEDFHVVVDHPLIGIAVNTDTEEVRFVMRGSDPNTVEKIDGGMISLAEGGDKGINWDVVEQALQTHEWVSLGTATELWGTEADVIQAGIQELADEASARGLVIEYDGDGKGEDIIYIGKSMR